MVRKTKAEAQTTRLQLLDAAEQVFLAQGVARTSLQQVAEAAGLTRGAVYWHFKDKADLFTAMMDRVTLPCECSVGQALADGGRAPQAVLQQLAMAPLRAVASDPRVQRVFSIAMHYTEYTAELAPVSERHRQAVGEFIDELAGLLARLPGLAAPQAAALGLFAMIDGLMRQWTLQPDSFDLVAVGEQAVAAHLRGLQAGDGVRPRT
jgi:TetR/AcrR family transcriptional regulator, acrAB operon repressor